MKKKKLVLFGLVALLLVSAMSLSARGTKPAGLEVELYVIAENPEHQAQEAELWGVFAEDHPGVTIRCESFEDTGYEAFAAKVNAGEAPMIVARDYPGMQTKDGAMLYVNLLDIDYPYWDALTVDMAELFESQVGLKDYVPGVQAWGSYPCTFIYHEDLMEEAGVTRDDVLNAKGWDDIDALMALLKPYVDGNADVDYVFDYAWSGWVQGKITLAMWAVSLGADIEDIQNLYLGKIAWTDLRNNPFVAPFEKHKEYYEKGYFPKNFWERLWEEDFEASFMAKNSVVTWHGPWLWTKVIAADPSARIAGFPVPVRDGIIAAYPVGPGGGGIFKQWEDTAEFETIKEAFIWYNSPENIKIRSDIYGFPPNLKPEYLEGFEMKHPQFQQCLKQSFAGVWGKVEWKKDAWSEVAEIYKDMDKPYPILDDAINPEIGKYLTGAMSMMDLMKLFEARWKAAYAEGLGM